MMQFSDIAGLLRKRGYAERETVDHHRVFYEFGTMDFLYSDVAKKFECDYKDGKVDKIVMTQYWFGSTTFKDIYDLEELKTNV